MEMTVNYLVTSLVVILLPGTGVLYTLAFGLGRGLRASLWAALGCTLGILPHIGASIAGLAALLHTSAVAFQIAKYIGVAYLFWMAWSVLRDGGALEVREQDGAAQGRAIVVKGILLNILNPKLSLFFLAFLPQFVPQDIAHPTLYMLELAAVFMALTFIVFAFYGLFASAARQYVISRPRVVLWLRRGFAGAFGALGVKLAFDGR
jgi:threonine/homoserine/homoserine lactone efflux protein